MNFKSYWGKLDRLRKTQILAGLVLVIVGAVFYSLFTEPNRWVTVEIKMLSEKGSWSNDKPIYWLSNTLENGIAEYDGLGRKIAKVESFQIFEKKDIGKDVFISLDIKARYNKRKRQYVFKGKPLGVGSVINLNFTSLNVNGLIINMPDFEAKVATREKIIEVKLQDFDRTFVNTTGIQPWLAETIEKGDAVRSLEGLLIAEVLDKRVESAEIITIDAAGNALLRRDPVKKDVYLKLKVLTTRVGGVDYYIGDIKVKVNEWIPLHFENYSIEPVITKIFD